MACYLVRATISDSCPYLEKVFPIKHNYLIIHILRALGDLMQQPPIPRPLVSLKVRILLSLLNTPLVLFPAHQLRQINLHSSLTAYRLWLSNCSQPPLWWYIPPLSRHLLERKRNASDAAAVDLYKFNVSHYSWRLLIWLAYFLCWILNDLIDHSTHTHYCHAY